MFVYRVGIDPRGRVLLILADEPVKQLLPMVIGQFEAKAIAMELAEQHFERPLTHDLLHNLVSSLGHRLDRVDVTKLEDETFYAELSLIGEGDLVKVDSRPSDAIALALRSGAPIFVAEDVLDRAAVLPEDIVVEDQVEGEEADSEADIEGGGPGPEGAESIDQVRRLLEGLDIEEGEEQ
jgi:hypothetical protein